MRSSGRSAAAARPSLDVSVPPGTGAPGSPPSPPHRPRTRRASPSGAHVAGDEDPGNAGLQQVTGPARPPSRRPPAVGEQVRTGAARSPASSRRSRAGSQSVGGAAPMKTNTCPHSTVVSVPLAVVQQLGRTPGGPPRASSTTSVPVRTSMLSIGSDLLDQVVGHRALQAGPADRRVTRAACREKNTAAWPAELAPPTMTTCCAGAVRAPRSAPSRSRRRGRQLVAPGRGQLPVGDAGGQDHGVRGDLAAVGEADHPGRSRGPPARPPPGR